jgi:ferritin
MLKNNIENALNDQMNFEYYSAYIYLSMAAYFDSINLPGFASWMRVQFQEEQFHGGKFAHYVAERGGRIVLDAIPKPQLEWESPLAAFETALHHEGIVTGRINEIVGLARQENDWATDSFLAWFVSEQVEEEATADGIVQQLKLVGDNGHALLMLDRELGARVFTPPASGE